MPGSCTFRRRPDRPHRSGARREPVWRAPESRGPTECESGRAAPRECAVPPVRLVVPRPHEHASGTHDRPDADEPCGRIPARMPRIRLSSMAARTGFEKRGALIGSEILSDDSQLSLRPTTGDRDRSTGADPRKRKKENEGRQDDEVARAVGGDGTVAAATRCAASPAVMIRDRCAVSRRSIRPSSHGPIRRRKIRLRSQ